MQREKGRTWRGWDQAPWANTTLGGIPGDEAWHWNEKTYQMLGAAYWKLISSDPKVRRDGIGDFYHLSRQFMCDEWNDYLQKWEDLRRENGAEPLDDILTRVGREGIELESHYVEPTSADKKLPKHADLQSETIENAVNESWECEQTSLF